MSLEALGEFHDILTVKQPAVKRLADIAKLGDDRRGTLNHEYWTDSRPPCSLLVARVSSKDAASAVRSRPHSELMGLHLPKAVIRAFLAVQRFAALMGP